MSDHPKQTADNECALLAAVLLDPDPERCRATLAATDAAWFADNDRAGTWRALARVMATDPPPPAGPARVKAVVAEGAGDPRGLGPLDLAKVTDAAPGTGTADYYAAKVRDAYSRRLVLPRLTEDERERLGDATPAEMIDLAETELSRARAIVADAPPLLPEALTCDGWDADPPAREWLVEGWIPAGELALLAGPGNAGKGLGLLTVQLAAALACDRDPLRKAGGWLPVGEAVTAEPPELCPDPCSVILAGWEDDRTEILPGAIGST
ncbi:MAG: AAA family ATPase [Spirochaetaceae bacterium]|nr:AAA family ATPase [Spirochaetaceae bacterium]